YLNKKRKRCSGAWRLDRWGLDAQRTIGVRPLGIIGSVAATLLMICAFFGVPPNPIAESFRTLWSAIKQTEQAFPHLYIRSAYFRRDHAAGRVNLTRFPLLSPNGSSAIVALWAGVHRLVPVRRATRKGVASVKTRAGENDRSRTPVRRDIGRIPRT